jgi:DNA-binding beta-propeller fold protein YncE
MGTRTHPTLAIAAAALVASCAHAPPRPSALPEVVWPTPPAAARVRLAALLPDPGAPAPRRSLWRAVVHLLAGTDPDERPTSWLERPFGVAAAADGSFVVADPDGPAVLRVDPGGAVARVTCRALEWEAPMAAALAPDGAVYVADAGRAAIVRVDAAGACRVLGAGVLERPTGIAVGADRLFVVDPPRHRITVLSLEGEILARWGARGTGPGELNFPTGIARAADGTLLVVDALNFRVARFSPEGRWLAAFGEAGDTGGALARPKAIAVDEAGRIYVSDAQRDLVLVYGPEGNFDYALGTGGSEPGALALPAGVAAAGGRLYVADSHNHRVQVFRILGGPS